MIKIGLREANLRFSRYVNMVKNGKKVVLTDRGKPVAVIIPVSQKEETEDEKLFQLEEQGLLKRSAKGRFPFRKLITLPGKPLSKIVSEEREEKHI
ncbi:MAG: type II toxin-antitoxin system prevent-host-death family antitoxin [Nitrospinota bacterium]|jgi:prevent-host-death family protein|nr:type II toxin-antitoxin system prevent-host-death family antitoxin [Nitrospinota bacterium]|tara:strand:- start:520 stop:807 length:288 start_codon:yes stop_codon:yes gene_type:complete